MHFAARCERDAYHYTPTILRLATAFDTTTDALSKYTSTMRSRLDSKS